MRLTWQLRTDTHKIDGAARSRRFSEGLKRMWANREPRSVICAQCSAEFFSTGMRAKLCSDECRRVYAARVARDKRAQRNQGEPAS
jgi:hypothetical protein